MVNQAKQGGNVVHGETTNILSLLTVQYSFQVYFEEIPYFILLYGYYR